MKMKMLFAAMTLGFSMSAKALPLLDILCEDASGKAVVDILNTDAKSTATVQGAAVTIVSVKEDRMTKFLYNGDIFRKKWPITDLAVVMSDGTQGLVSYVPDHGSKNTSEGSVVISINGSETTISNCQAYARTY